MDRTGIRFREHDWLARGQRGTSQDHRIASPTGLINTDGPLSLSRGGALQWAGSENGIDFPVVDERATHRAAELRESPSAPLTLKVRWDLG